MLLLLSTQPAKGADPWDVQDVHVPHWEESDETEWAVEEEEWLEEDEWAREEEHQRLHKLKQQQAAGDSHYQPRTVQAREGGTCLDTTTVCAGGSIRALLAMDEWKQGLKGGREGSVLYFGDHFAADMKQPSKQVRTVRRTTHTPLNSSGMDMLGSALNWLGGCGYSTAGGLGC